MAVADRMTFQQDSDSSRNDRLLMFSMLGVVVMTALAFMFSYFSRDRSVKAEPAPPAVIIEQPSPPPQRVAPSDGAPAPAPQYPEVVVTPAPPPTEYTPPVVETPPPSRSILNGPRRNRKLAGLAEEAFQQD